MVSDFPVARLHETIPDFHHTPKRFEAFVEAVERDSVNRARLARAEIEFVQQRAADTSVLLDLLEAGWLTRRVTHNDTKFDNVLFDQATGEGLCLIDLDTVMPGLVAYDFGDAIRSAANSAVEDEPDLARVSFDLDLYEQLAAGYLEAAGAFLSPAEIDTLAFSARLMTLECGIRFLTDYLDGDRYFRILRPGHNLDRCRTQFKLVRDMEASRAEMERIVDRWAEPVR
jgi:Ser/Thr protein kinase RdoA (MazF antagonist)